MWAVRARVSLLCRNRMALSRTLPRRNCHAGSVLDGAIECPEDFERNRLAMEGMISEVRAETEQAMKGGGERAVERHLKRDKLLPRDRISALLDVGSPFLELSALAGHELYGEEYVPSGGMICGIGSVEGRKTMVIANDPTVKGGTLYPITVKKQLRAQQIAMENRLPCVYLLESGGANLPRQAEIFPDMYHGGRTFYNMANLSAAGIPQISIVLGSCTAGGAYAATMADEVVMVEGKGTIFLGGPPLAKAATGEVVTAEELGGARVHTQISGCADHLAEDEPHALRIARRLVANCAPPAAGSLARSSSIEPPRHAAAELNGLVPSDPRQPLPIRKILARLLDGSKLAEFKAEFGSTLITGFGKINGYTVGIVANDGILFSESAQKGAHFIELCCQRGTPLLFLQNITGFMVGKEYEHGGIAKHGAKLVHAVSTARVPKFTVVVGNSFGAGNYGMCGRAYGARMLWMWPNAQIGVMGGEQAANVLAQVKQEAAEKAGGSIPEGKLTSFRDGVRARFESEAGAMYSTARIWDDGILEPAETRTALTMALSAASNAPIEETRFGVFRM
jgi:3-methylcrotonyl-CoA carboxylase beta subunit